MKRPSNIALSYSDGAAYSLMVGFGETYLAAFALAAGLGQVTAGLVGSVPLLAGGGLQLLAPLGARRLGSLRRWVVLCASLQGLAYLPLALAAWHGTISTGTLYLLAALYWGAGMAAGPAWNIWIDAIIPSQRFREFLAVRSRLTQLAAFVAFLGGGWILTEVADRGMVLAGFALLFTVAGLCRALSVRCLAGQSEAPAPAAPRLPLGAVLARFRGKDASRFLLFLLASTAAVNVGGAFFSPYMLGHVHFSYWQYVALVSASYSAKIVFYPQVAAWATRHGPYRTLCVAALGISPLPLFWFWTPQLPALIAVQVYAGVAWAAFELSSTLLVFDRIKAHERLEVLTLYNLFNAGAVTVGSLLGGWVLSRFPEGDAYHFIFVGSSTLRCLSIGTLVGLQGLQGLKGKARVLGWRVLSLRPSQGAFVQPILAEEEELFGFPPEPDLDDLVSLPKGIENRIA